MSDCTGIRQTCPSINKVKESIKNAIRYLKSAEKELNENDVHWALYELDGCDDYLEEIRNANAGLREIAITKAQELIELESK